MNDSYSILKSKIKDMRQRLDVLIESGATQDDIYTASVELDELLAEFMRLEQPSICLQNAQ